MTVIHLLTLMICWCVVEVNSQQTFPYVSFMGQTLANHSYVNLSLVEDDFSGSDNVICHTDLTTCCSVAQGVHRGDWYFPNGNRLLFFGDIHEWRGAQRVYLRRRNSATSPVGIYHCGIPTNADRSVRATVYVGLYTASGGMFYHISLHTDTFSIGEFWLSFLYTVESHYNKLQGTPEIFFFVTGVLTNNTISYKRICGLANLFTISRNSY